jgi:hypothetical protein
LFRALIAIGGISQALWGFCVAENNLDFIALFEAIVCGPLEARVRIKPDDLDSV